MAISPKILQQRGCSPKAWKALFTADDSKKLPQIKELELLIEGRLRDGRLRNFREYRTYQALDLAYDAPFSQTTPTMITALLRKNLSEKEMLAEIEAWGLNENDLFLTTKHPNGTETRTLNAPTFFNVLVPLVKGYVTIRRAKLFNERNLSPLLKYEPLHANTENRILCEILTDVVQVITSNYGYATDLNDIIFNTLMYSFCLAFPKEVWHTEYQLEMDDAGKPIKVLQKEGIRYVLPHPTQVSWDLKSPVSKFNTDTGPEWAAFWQVVSYGSVADNTKFWNKKRVGFGKNDYNAAGGITYNFFQEVYPCGMSFPVFPAGASETNRESNSIYYNSNMRDKAVFQTDVAMKIIPSDWGLGDYDYPIWVRFVVAADKTVLYAEPYCYCPVLYYGYDADSGRSRNSSLALEVLPFQDLLGNILSQILLTCKQNLSQVNFYDKNIINKAQIDDIANRPGRLYQGMNFIEGDSIKSARAGLDVKQAIHTVGFTYKDPSAMFQSINMIIMLLERILQISSQEAGSQASHQQSAAEIRLAGGSSDNRVLFTGSFIDSGMDAMKKQLFDATQAFMDDEVVSYVPGDIPGIEAHLEKLGFSIIGTTLEGKIQVRGSKTNIKWATLVATGKGVTRMNDSQTAQILMQTIQVISANEVILQAVGPKTILNILEQAVILAGADKDFKIRADVQAQANQIQQLAQQIQQAAVKQVEADVTAPAAKAIHDVQQDVAKLQAVVVQLMQMAQGKPPVAPPVDPNAQPPTLPPPNGPQINAGAAAPGTPVGVQ